MNVSEKRELGFYQSIGKLFYAIAAADKIVRKKEYDALRKLVKEQWKSMDDYKDDFNTDSAYQIEIVFDWMDYEQLDAANCFEEFKDFKKENDSLFTKERKNLIWETANAIANSFAGKNKSELIMLAKLKSLLK